MGQALRLRVEPELSSPVLVLAFEGWNDAGEAATSAVRFLSDAVSAVPLGEIEGEEFYDFTVCRPVVSVPQGAVRSIEWPEVAFRFASLEGVCDLVLGIGPEPHFRWGHFTDLIVRLAATVGARRVLLLGAYLADVVYSLPVQVSGIASHPERLGELGVEPSRYEGPTGIVGVLGERFHREGLEVLSLWAGLPHYINASPNARGALALIQKLVRALALPLDDAPLRASAAEFEQRISDLVARDPELSEYVRQLKRRSFAQ